MEPNTIYVQKLNEVYLRIYCEDSIKEELSEHFTFEVENAHLYKIKNGFWNGKKKLFNKLTRTLYIGLLDRLEDFAKDRGYTMEVDFDYFDTEFSAKEADEFIDTLNIPLGKRDYQIRGFLRAIRKRRALLLSPTASGKSLMIYYIIRYLLSKGLAGFIVVPTTALVEQMFTDFQDYAQNDSGFDVFENMHRVYSGKSKFSPKSVIITTWQSVYDMPKEYFKGYDFIIGDEAHEFKAKSLVSIMEKLVDTTYRIGTTGTLDGKYVHQLVIEGLFGKTYSLAKTKSLIDREILSAFTIKALHLKHSYPIREYFSTTAKRKHSYNDELDFLFANPVRNNYIKNLALSLKGNTLILFRTIAHGKHLHNLISSSLEKGRECYFIYGGTDVEIREQIRTALEGHDNAILIASFGTFSRGSNVRNLHNLIFASPVKSRIRTLQSIGRVLRRSDKKDRATLFDIGDDLRLSSSFKPNFSLAHFIERLDIYTKERFDYKLYRVQLKESLPYLQPNLTNQKILPLREASESI